MAKQMLVTFPEGFDPTLLDEWKEKYGLKVHADGDSAGETDDSQHLTETPIYDPVIQDAPFLELPSHILAKIANRLDAPSFLALARSCRRLLDFYRQSSSQNKVEVRLEWYRLVVYTGHDGTDSFSCRSELSSSSLFDEKASMCVDSLLNWPFAVHIGQLKLEVDDVLLARKLLTRLKAQSLRKIKICSSIEYEDLVALIDEYSVKSVKWECADTQEAYSEDEVKALLHMPLQHLTITDVESRLLPDATIPELFVFGLTSVDPADLVIIIQNFSTTDTLIDWKLDHGDMAVRVFTSCLSKYPLFLIHYTDPLPPIRPLAFFSHGDEDNHVNYYILRPDGRIVFITNIRKEYYIRIKFISLAEAPAIFARV